MGKLNTHTQVGLCKSVLGKFFLTYRFVRKKLGAELFFLHSCATPANIYQYPKVPAVQKPPSRVL